MKRIPDGVAGERQIARLSGEEDIVRLTGERQTVRLGGEEDVVRLPGESRGPGTPCLDSGSRVRNDASALWRLLSVCLLATTLWAHGPASAGEARDADQHFFNLNTGDLKAEAHDAKQAGKKALFFMFEQEGCPGCLHMKRNVLNRGDVQAYYRERFVNFSIDIHGAVPLRDFAGRDFTEKRYAQTLRINATPTLVFFDLDGNEIARVIGPVKDAAEFLLLGEFVASGAYRLSRFADYKQVRRKRRGG